MESTVSVTTRNRKLSELRKEIILIQLSSGKSVPTVAKEMNIHPGHIYDWLRTHEGVDRIESSLRDAREILESRLPNLVTQSLDVIESALGAPFMSDNKMKAAKTVLQVFTRLSLAKKPECEQCRSRTLEHE